jgi:ribose transport system ATP-binding protein
METGVKSMGRGAGPVISISGLRKSFGSVEVLHGIDLNIPAGQIVGLMGPNGAGKSTLIKILAGVYPRTEGTIMYRNQSVRNLAERKEVGFLHQDLGLIEDLTIVDNLRLGEPPLRLFGPILSRRGEAFAAAKALERVQLDRPLDMLVADLSPGEKALVAIARLINRGANVLFIDEATSTLPPADARRLIDALKLLVTQEGATVVMVSHKLSEILDAATYVVMMLDGDVASEVESTEFARKELVALLMSHEMEDRSEHVVNRDRGKALMKMEGVWGGGAGPIDMDIYAGQIVGITGLAGSGLHDVAHLVNGSLRPTRGRITHDNVSRALVPPHRETQGGFEDLSVVDNLTVSALDLWRTSSGILNLPALNRDGESMIGRLAVTPRDLAARFGALSGGNKQKVIFGRALLHAPAIYVLCEPTRGVDLVTRGAIYRLIEELAQAEAGVLVVTSDSEDLFAVCDQIAVVNDGKLGDFIWADETNPQELEAFI